jgi:hypothetical protein
MILTSGVHDINCDRSGWEKEWMEWDDKASERAQDYRHRCHEPPGSIRRQRKNHTNDESIDHRNVCVEIVSSPD